MQTSGDNRQMGAYMDVFWWVLGATALMGLGVYLHAEWRVYHQRTRVSRNEGGKRFEAHHFLVDIRQAPKRVRVKARHAYYSQDAREGQSALEKTGALDVTFDVQGLRIESLPMPLALPPGRAGQEERPSGLHSLVFHATQEAAVLRVDHVPEKVNQEFMAFAQQIQRWAERIEQQQQAKLEAQEAARRHAEEAEAARAAAKALAKSRALSPDEQIAQWRRVAGFTGTTSEIGLDTKGHIEWFIDIDPLGRITLHAGKQTAHTTLQGATIASLGGELEINVLDEDGHPDPHTFRILKGSPPDVRRAWKERLEQLRDKLRNTPQITQ